MKYKLIVSDFDGTIFRSDYTVSEATRNAVQDYIKAGGKFVIATGRLYCAIKPYTDFLGIDGEIITYQGSCIFDIKSGRELYSQTIANDMACQLLDYLYFEMDINKCIPMIYYDDSCYTTESNEYIDYYTGVVNVPARFTGIPLNEYVNQEKILPHKVLALVPKEEARGMIDKLLGKFGDYFNINQSSPGLLEMVNKTASKGKAIEWLIDKYNFKRDEVIAIGDAENDISMVEYAGLGVAVANAMENLKNVADYIADTNDNDGVAKIIRQFGLQHKI